MLLEILTDFISDQVEELSIIMDVQDLDDDTYDNLVTKCKDFHQLVIKNPVLQHLPTTKLDIMILSYLTHINYKDDTLEHYKYLYSQ